MANKNDIKRWEKGQIHWNMWANKLLEERLRLKNEKLWHIGNIGIAENAETIEWVKNATVDFSEHHFENGADFSEIVFPFIAMAELEGLAPPTLDKLSVNGTNFTNAILREANFYQANMLGMNFTGATLETANLSKTNLLNIFFNTANLIGSNFEGAKISGCQFVEATIDRVDFSDVTKLDNCTFNLAKLVGASFSGLICGGSFTKADLSNTHFENATFQNCSFEGAILENAYLANSSLINSSFNKANCSAAIFSGADLTGARFIDADVSNAHFNHATIINAHFQSAKLVSTDFQGANLEGSHFTSVKLGSANLKNAVLKRVDFSAANIVSANMLGASFDKDTKFLNDPQVKGLSVDRFALECLDKFGGLSVGARMKLNIHDDVATLRSYYSGYKQWIHLMAFATFAFPYLWFIVTQWGKASFKPENSDHLIPLWQALFRFIYSGGNGWEQGWAFSWSFIFFVVALLYNILRAVLLAKTKRLELTQESSGLPAAFSLNDRVSGSFGYVSWGGVFLTSKIGFYIYLSAVLLNLIHFFSMEIPIQYEP